MANELVTLDQCGVKKSPAENIGPQFCPPDIATAFRDTAVDPMNYQAAVQFFKLNMGVLTSKNRYVQFAINATADNAARQIRFGAIGETGDYLLYNVAAGAADIANMVDDYGANVRKVQGWSKLTSKQPMFVTQFRLISSSATQLSAATTYNTINPDMSITTENVNLAATLNKSDQSTTLMVAYGTWCINPNHNISLTSVFGQSVTVVLEVSAVDNARNFVML